MSWPGPAGIRPTFRLAWSLITGAALVDAMIDGRPTAEVASTPAAAA